MLFRSLYRWCGANVNFSNRYSYYGMTILTGNRLVEEIRNHLKGDARLHALDTVLTLMTPLRSDVDSRAQFHSFVLATWQRELSAPEVYLRCREICEQVIEDHQSNQVRLRGTLELAALFRASGGNTERALDGFEPIMLPKEGASTPTRQMVYTTSGGTSVTYSSGSTNSPTSRTNHRFPQLWPPETTQARTNSDPAP